MEHGLAANQLPAMPRHVRGILFGGVARGVAHGVARGVALGSRYAAMAHGPAP